MVERRAAGSGETTLVSETLKVAYTPIPKCASSSVKRAWYFMTRGRQCRGDVHRQLRPQLVPFPDDPALFSFAVVRDPISRFLSAFGNRVVHFGELGEKAFSKAHGPRGKLPPADPDLGTFVDRLEEYRRISPSIRHHTAPMTDFVGVDLRRYDRLFDVADTAELASELSRRAGTSITLPRSQTGGPKFAVEDLSPRHLRKLVLFYYRDYAVLHLRYRPPNP